MCGSGRDQDAVTAWEKEVAEGRFADVTFRVGDKDFHLSRMPFSLASPVFAAMLFPGEGHRWKEHESDAVVRLSDIEPSAFEQMARHAYRIPLMLTPANVVDTKVAADKYHMANLVAACKAKVTSWKNDADSCLLLLNSEIELAGDTHDLGEALLLHGSRVWKSKHLNHVSANTLRWLLSSHAVADEDDVWDFCYAWARQNGSTSGKTIQDSLRHFCSLIRFPLISPKRLDLEILSEGIISPQLGLDVLMHARGTKPIPGFPGPRFGFDASFSLGTVNICDRSAVAEISGGTLGYRRMPSPSMAVTSPGFTHGSHSWTITWMSSSTAGSSKEPIAYAFPICSAHLSETGKIVRGEVFQKGNAVGFNTSDAGMNVISQDGLQITITIHVERQLVEFKAFGGASLFKDFEFAHKTHLAIYQVSKTACFRVSYDRQTS